jgi:hypothetical protein
VAEDRIDPSDQIPEADLLEQQAALDPPLTDAEHMQVVVPEAPTEPVNEADRWEQQTPVPPADDDYPHDLFQTGWS